MFPLVKKMVTIVTAALFTAGLSIAKLVFGAGWITALMVGLITAASVWYYGYCFRWKCPEVPGYAVRARWMLRVVVTVQLTVLWRCDWI